MKLEIRNHTNSKIAFVTVNILLSVLYGLIFTSLAALLLSIVLTIVLTILANDGIIYKYCTVVTALFFVMVLCTYFGWINQTGKPYLIGGSDDLRFEEIADIYISRGWFDFTEDHGYTTNTRLYVFIIIILKKISSLFGGYSPVLPRILNGFILMGCLCYSKKIMERVWGFSEETINLVLRMLSANFFLIYVCSYSFRDPLCLLFVLQIIYYNKLAVLGDISKVKGVAILAILLFFGYYIRSQLLLIGIVLIIIGFLFGESKNNGIMIVLISLIALISIVLDSRYGIFGFIESKNMYTEYQTQSEGLSHAIIGMKLFPFGLIARIVYALIYPFPAYSNLFQYSNNFLVDFATFLTYVYEFYQFVHLPNIVVGLKKKNFEISAYFCLFLVLFCVATFTFRHYIFMIPFLTMLLGSGELDPDIFRNNKSIMKAVAVFLYFVMVIVYTIIKV